jgi:hypothetical protein
MDEKSDKSWTVVCLRANLKENGGRRGGRKQNLLDLAILYFDGFFGDFGDFESNLGANSTAVTITEAQLTSERQICNFYSVATLQIVVLKTNWSTVKRWRHLSVKSCIHKVNNGGF